MTTTVEVIQEQLQVVVQSPGPQGGAYASGAAQAATEGARDAAIAAQGAAEDARDAAVVAQGAAEAARDDAQQDATATAADALATGADRVQTGLDATATAADRVQTGLDAAATAGDRVQTGLDAAATAGDRVQTGLDAAATAGDRIQTSLDATATAADALATGADRVQTGLDASTASTQAGIATTQAGIATTQAGTATTQAGTATTQAGIATTQAGIATTQAGNALTSANNAAASFDSFDDRYLGAKAAAPTVDNDGQTLLTGALYWDTSLSALRVWTGATWTNTTELDARVLADQQLLEGIAYSTDMALQAVREGIRAEASLNASMDAVEATVLTYDSAITNAIYQLTALADLAGVVARAISGGDVILRAGTAANPSISADGDRNTGVLFPAADAVAATTAGVERWRTDSNGYTGLGTNAPSGVLDVNDSKLRVRTAKTPASAGAAGNTGEICWDASYVYVCVGTNTWKRAALSTW